jgi:hypothetical protein
LIYTATSRFCIVFIELFSEAAGAVTRRFALLALLSVVLLVVGAGVRADSWEIEHSYELEDIGIAEFLAEHLSVPGVDDHGVDLGIGSDLWHNKNDPPGVYWMITDRGPNAADPRTFAVPEFTPFIVKVRTTDRAIEILEAIPLTGVADTTGGVTGIPNSENAGAPPAINEPFFRCNGVDQLKVNPNGVDTEGLVRTRDGTFWISEEYSPSILKVDPHGRVVKRFFPTSLLDSLTAPVTGYATDDSETSIPAIYGIKRKLNRGFEGLTISPDETTLYIALESPLANPDLGAGNNSRNTRILAFDTVHGRAAGEFVYRFEPTGPGRADDVFDVPWMRGEGGHARPRDMKISAISMIDANRMLVVERTDFKARIFIVDFRGATNILGTVWDDVDKEKPSLEQLNGDGLPELMGIHPLRKELLITLDPADGFPPKIEGLAILDNKTIAITNDNDFGLGSFITANGSCRLNDTGRQTHIIVLRLDRPLRYG